jgi:hypothetical protein
MYVLPFPSHYKFSLLLPTLNRLSHLPKVTKLVNIELIFKSSSNSCWSLTIFLKQSSLLVTPVSPLSPMLSVCFQQIPKIITFFFTAERTEAQALKGVWNRLKGSTPPKGSFPFFFPCKSQRVIADWVYWRILTSYWILISLKNQGFILCGWGIISEVLCNQNIIRQSFPLFNHCF